MCGRRPAEFSGRLAALLLAPSLATGGCLRAGASGGGVAEQPPPATAEHAPAPLAAAESAAIASDPAAVTTTRAREHMLQALRKLAAAPGFALGQQDATAYGVGWSGDIDRSDVKSL